IEMRQREMGAELLMREVATDFDIELMRQDKTRELQRRRPLELETNVRPDANTANALQANNTNDHSEPFAILTSTPPRTDDANSTATDPDSPRPASSAATPCGDAETAADMNANTRHDDSGSPRTLNTRSGRTVDANDTSKAN